MTIFLTTHRLDERRAAPAEGRGAAVPADMAVVGYDDIEVATIVLPELTSVRQPKYEPGRVAADLLFSEIDDGEHRHRQILFEPGAGGAVVGVGGVPPLPLRPLEAAPARG